MNIQEAKIIVNNRQGTFARTQKEVDEYYEACNLLYKTEQETKSETISWRDKKWVI